MHNRNTRPQPPLAIATVPPWTPDGVSGEGTLALLQTIASVCWRNKVKLVVWVGACVALAWAYASTLPANFTATATLLLEPRRGGSLPARESSGLSTLDGNRAESELQVIRSERLLYQVFSSLNLAEDPELKPAPVRPSSFDNLLTMLLSGRRTETGPTDVPTTAPKVFTAYAEFERQLAFLNFFRRVSARRIGQSYVVEISYSSSNDDVPSKVANALASAYLLQSVVTKADVARNGGEFVQARLDALSEQEQLAKAAMQAGLAPESPLPDADARIIGVALKPLSSTAPKKSLLMALGGAMGALSGLLFAALAGVARGRVVSGREAVGRTGMPLLGIVPRLGRWTGRGSAGRTVPSPLVAGSSSRFRAGSARQRAYATALRNLRGAINLVCPLSQAEERQLIALASWRGGESSLHLTLALARSIAALGREVVVVDANPGAVRRGDDPEGRAAASIVDVIVGRAAKADAELDVGVCYLRLASDDAALLDAIEYDDPRLLDCLDGYQTRGHVLVALPGLSSTPGARALARHADAVVVIVEAGQTTSQQVESCIHMLKAVGANVIGLVVDRAST